jgi:type IV secretion system protein TrbL
MKRHAIVSLGIVAGLALLLVAEPALAQTTTNNALDTIVDKFQGKFTSIEGALMSSALRLFWLLALIEFTYAALGLVFKQADFGEWAATMVNQILFIGLFAAILINGASWGNAIVQSFREAGSNASMAAGGGATLKPSDVFDAGLQIATTALSKLDVFEPSQSIAYAIGGIVIIVSFALIAAMMILTLVSAWGIVSMSILFLGFGGSRFTKDVAMKVIMAVFGVGAKLFVMQVIVGIGYSLFQDWSGDQLVTISDLLVMVGCAVVMLALVKVIPDLVQSMVSGSAFTGGGALSAVGGAVAGGVAGAAAGVVGAGVAAHGAGKLASEQLATASGQGTAPTSSMGRLMSLAGNTGRNLAGAAMQDVGARLGGRAHHGSMGGRMGDNMRHKAGEMRAAREAPTPAPATASAPAAAPASNDTDSNSISAA